MQKAASKDRSALELRSVMSGFRQGFSLTFMGLAAGVAGGWVSLIMADGPEDVAGIGARFYLALVVALPLATWLMIRYDVTQNPLRYARPGPALTHMLVLGAFGGLSATLLFIVGAGQIPAIFGGESAADVIEALYPAIGWMKVIAVMAVTIASSIIVAIWANRKARVMV